MPQIHLSVPVMEDGVLYNRPNIKRNILNDSIIEQGTLGSHFTHVRRQGAGNPFSLINERFLQMVPNRSAAPSLMNPVTSKFGVGSSLARPYLVGNFCLLLNIGGSTKAPRKTMKSNGTKVAQTICRAPTMH